MSDTKKKYIYACGKRKTSIARVRLFLNGKGDISINGKPMKDYFPVKSKVDAVVSPLKLTGNVNKYDFTIKVTGGGITGQSDACRHGIVKALILNDGLLRPALKKAGLLTRDSRIKERKKYGLKRARKAPQFSKR